MVEKWEYCALQLEQKVSQRSGAPQVYRGVKVEGSEEAVWEVQSTLRLPGGQMHKRILGEGMTFVDELNELGKEGWELVEVVDEKNGIFDSPQATVSSSWMAKSFLFRRPVG